MSQAILKLQDGNKLEIVRTKPEAGIQWGTNKLKVDDVNAALSYKNIDQLLASNNIKGKDAEEIHKLTAKYADAIRTGNLSKNADGTYSINPSYINSLAIDNTPLKKDIFGNLKGDKKQIAVNYIESILSGVSPVITEKKPEPTKEETKQLPTIDRDLGNRLKLEAFRSTSPKESDIQNWYKMEDRFTPALKVLRNYKNELANSDVNLEETPFKSKDEYLAALNELEKGLESKDTTAINNAFYKLGESDLSQLFTTLSTTSTTGEVTAADETEKPKKTTKVPQLVMDNKGDEPMKKHVSIPKIARFAGDMLRPGLGSAIAGAYELYPKINFTEFLNSLKNLIPESVTEPFTSYKQGGVLKGQQGISFNPKTNWFSSIYTPISADLLNGINSGKVRYEDLNKLQDLHSNITQSAGTDWQNTAYSNPSVGKYQKTFNNLLEGIGNTKGIANGLKSGRYVKSQTANSADRPNTWVDNLYSGMTNDRTLLGREGDYTPEQLTAEQSKWNKEGLELFVDPTTKYYKLRMKQLSVPSLKPVIPKINIGEIRPNIELASSEVPEKPNALSKLNLDSNLLSNARFGLTYLMNNRVKMTPRVLVTDAPQATAKVQYNLPMQNFYNRSADQYRRMGNTTATSDQTQNFARQLQLESEATNQDLKGALANQEAFAKTSENVVNTENANIAARINNANQNRARMLEAQSAKEIFDNNKKVRQMGVLTNWLAEKQKNLEQKEGVQRQLEAQAGTDLIGRNYQTTIENAYKDLQRYPEDSPEYKAALEKYNLIVRNAQNQANDSVRQLQAKLFGTGYIK